jgi:hypothetical protein
MHSAYRAAGAQAEFERVPAFGADGHALFDPEAARLDGGRRALPRERRDQR